MVQSAVLTLCHASTLYGLTSAPRAPIAPLPLALLPPSWAHRDWSLKSRVTRGHVCSHLPSTSLPHQLLSPTSTPTTELPNKEFRATCSPSPAKGGGASPTVVQLPESSPFSQLRNSAQTSADISPLVFSSVGC